MTAPKFLYTSGLLRITPRNLERWKQMQDTKMLLYALKHGRYDVRLSVVQYLGELRDRNTTPALHHSMHDRVKAISVESIEALRKLRPNAELEAEMEEKLSYWQKEDERRKNLANKEYTPYMEMPEWKKRDWLGIVKEMLRKPLRR